MGRGLYRDKCEEQREHYWVIPAITSDGEKTTVGLDDEWGFQ